MDNEFFNNQIYPASVENKELFLIPDIQNIIYQLDSLRDEALLQIKARTREIVFYRDYNALTIAIEILKKELKVQNEK